MNVGELKEALDDFGDHLEVHVVHDELNRRWTNFDVDTQVLSGEPFVTIQLSE